MVSVPFSRAQHKEQEEHENVGRICKIMINHIC